jgi:hypothetical protein
MPKNELLRCTAHSDDLRRRVVSQNRIQTLDTVTLDCECRIISHARGVPARPMQSNDPLLSQLNASTAVQPADWFGLVARDNHMSRN